MRPNDNLPKPPAPYETWLAVYQQNGRRDYLDESEQRVYSFVQITHFALLELLDEREAKDAELAQAKQRGDTWMQRFNEQSAMYDQRVEELASETARADKFRAELTACMERNRTFEKGEEEAKRKAFGFEQQLQQARQQLEAANERIKELTKQ